MWNLHIKKYRHFRENRFLWFTGPEARSEALPDSEVPKGNTDTLKSPEDAKPVAGEKVVKADNDISRVQMDVSSGIAPVLEQNGKARQLLNSVKVRAQIGEEADKVARFLMEKLQSPGLDDATREKCADLLNDLDAISEEKDPNKAYALFDARMTEVYALGFNSPAPVSEPEDSRYARDTEKKKEGGAV